MSNALATISPDQLPSTQIGNDEAYVELSKGADFLGRLQLFTKGAAIDEGKIPPGHYGIPEGEKIIDLGTSIDILPLARRPKALDMSDKEAIVTTYDQNSDEFKAIAEKSFEQNSGCQYGTSFLVLERQSGRFLELFFGSKSTRPEAKNIFPYLPLTEADIRARGLKDVEQHGPLPVTLKVRLIKAKFSWHVPVVQKCSTPFEKVPSMAAIVKEITKFITIKNDGTEKVAEPAGKKARAR